MRRDLTLVLSKKYAGPCYDLGTKILTAISFRRRGYTFVSFRRLRTLVDFVLRRGLPWIVWVEVAQEGCLQRGPGECWAALSAGIWGLVVCSL